MSLSFSLEFIKNPCPEDCLSTLLKIFVFLFVKYCYNVAFLSTQEQLKRVQVTKHRLFIGNPGAGKSTLINCLVKRVLFTSGICIGSGKTSRLEKAKHDGIMYLDTPGLADFKMRRAAASAITQALKQNGCFQIFFVVTLTAGRLRPEDLTTIWLVLLNAPDIKSFSIIINKVSKAEHVCLQNDEEKSKVLAPLEIISGGHKCDVFPLLIDEILEDADNKIANYPELDNFVRDAPWVDIDSANVIDIPGDENSFKEQVDLLTDKIKSLHDSDQSIVVRLTELFQRLAELFHLEGTNCLQKKFLLYFSTFLFD